MIESETAWQKFIRNTLHTGETYASAESFYTDIDPDIQELLDAQRLIRIGENPESEEELHVGKQRLKDAVIRILDRPNAKEHPGYLHARNELITVRVFYREDPKVQQLVRQYLEKG